jgi:hypothetical protein
MAAESKTRVDLLLVVLLAVALGGMAMLFYKSQSRMKALPSSVGMAAPEKAAPIAPVTPPSPPPQAVVPTPPKPLAPTVPQASQEDKKAAVPPVQHHYHRIAPQVGAVAGAVGGNGAAAPPPPAATPPPPPPPPPVEDDATKLDDALAHLKPGNLAYSTPTQMKMAETAHIVAKIGTDAVSAAALQAGMPTDAGTQVAMAATSITPKMKMSLASGDFDITPLSSEEQLVAGTVPTTWEWDIVPKHTGELQLNLAATIELNGLAKDFTTVDREIAVQVDPADVVGDFLKGNWQWLIATLTGIVGAAWRYFSGRKKAAVVEVK